MDLDLDDLIEDYNDKGVPMKKQQTTSPFGVGRNKVKKDDDGWGDDFGAKPTSNTGYGRANT